MRHKKAGRQFSRDTSSRRAMLRNLAANLITHERIETTDAKAKELRRVAERLITKARRIGKTAYTPQADLSEQDKAKRLHVSRLISSFIPRFGVKTDGTKIDLVEKVLLDLSKRFAERPGGYTRIVKVGNRRGDNAPISVIEFVDVAAPVDKQKVAAPVVEEPAEAAAAAG
ncbi:MAG: 50S ribosomal protein L17 [Polyangiaceae bacterium]|jgi:large subunit ribosomal protein L17|nr:50S ribosomal protein L17 [Polyangiaceae bacterium]